MKTRAYIVALYLAVVSPLILPTYPAEAKHRHEQQHRPTHRASHRRIVSHSPSVYLLEVNGKVLMDHNPDLRRPPASLTKIMTALVVLEHGRLDEVVKVSQAASRETGSRIGLRRGERLKVRDLLAAMLLASANDAARALADYVGGSQPAFVKLMNQRAQTLDLKDTRFTNACGHDDKGLYTTAHDLAILADHALRDPVFSDLVSRRTMRIATVNGRRSYAFHNMNRLIGSYPGARGVKTGTTPNAGKCLVALAERGDTKVFLVLMNAQDRWRRAPVLLDAGFAAVGRPEPKPEPEGAKPEPDGSKGAPPPPKEETKGDRDAALP